MEISNNQQQDIFLQMHYFFRRLQQRNRFVDIEPESQLTLAETHLLKQVITQPDLTQTEYKKLFSLPQSHIGRIIDRLQIRGLLKKNINPNDSRLQILTLTDEGKKAVKLSDRVVTECYLSFSRLLNKTEKEQLIDFFKQIADGYGHPQAIKRPEETEYSLHQRRITRCFRLLGKGVFNSQLNSTQWQLLAALGDANSFMTPSVLAKKIGVTNPTASAVLKNLAKDKMISIEQNRLDKRSFRVTITEQGRKELAKIEQFAANELKNALKNHSIKKCQNWLKIFRKYVVDSDDSLAVPDLDLKLVHFKSVEQRILARSNLIKHLYEEKITEFCPSTLVADSNLTIGFQHKNQLEAIFDFSNDGKFFLLTCGYIKDKQNLDYSKKILQALSKYLKQNFADKSIICKFEPLARIMLNPGVTF